MGGIAPRLAETFTVYRYDRRGKGESGDAVHYQPDRETEDLVAMLALTDRPAFVYGFSSGSVIGLRAAASGAPISRLVALEPPMVTDEGRGPDIRSELQDLVGSGQRSAAIRRYHESIGVPAEILDNMDTTALEPAAHTMVYDLTLLRATALADWAATKTPTLVLASAGSDTRLIGWAQSASAALPNGHLKVVPGAWHGIPDDLLIAEITEFFEA